MGLEEKSSGSNYKYLKLKMLDKDKPTKRLALFDQKKDGDAYVVDKEYGAFTGVLVGAEATSYESVDGTKHGFSLVFHDNDQLYKVEMNQNFATRGFINSLLNLQDYTEPVKFWCNYWNEYWGITVMEPNNAKAVRWKMSTDQMPAAEVFEIPNSTKKVVTYEKLEKFFIKAVNALNDRAVAMNGHLLSRIADSKPVTIVEDDEITAGADYVAAAVETVTKGGFKPIAEAVASDEADDDLPF